MIKCVENLCHIIIMPCFQLCVNFATFERTRVKFPHVGD